MKNIIYSLFILLSCTVLGAAPVVTICNGNGSTDVKFSVEYNKPYWTVGKGRSTTNRIFRYDENTRRIMPIRGGWLLELKNSTPDRLVNKQGKVILEYRNGNIYKPGSSSAVAVCKNNALFKGSKCIANFRNGNLPTGLMLTVAAQYYLADDLGFKPLDFSAPKPQVKEVKLHILSLPFNKQAVTKYLQDGKVIYTFRNGFIYEGEALKDDTNAARYAVSLGKFAAVGKKKIKKPYIIHFFDLKNKTFVPLCTAQNIVRYALISGSGVEGEPLLHMGSKGLIYAGSTSAEPIACINADGSKLYKGSKAEGTPVLSVEGNRFNYWVDWFVWSKVLEKEISDYLAAHPEAKKPFSVDGK
ncbi:MAG: hypothetical protein E7052_02630 [Lentisphaerae bacterium]|nr:hypothetical protein [Lentisphaerota bacterium]